MTTSEQSESPQPWPWAATDAITELCRADYHAACAASLLESVGLTDWQERADRLMRDCIALREEMAKARTAAAAREEGLRS